jgi:acyl-CoA dehydrogenase
MQQAIDALINNFPNKLVAKLLRGIILPLGCHLTKPSDKTDHKVARILQTPSETRDRLGQGQYLTRESSNVLGQLEQTLDDILASEPIFDKVCQALNSKLPFYNLDEVAKKGLEIDAITTEEAELLCRTEKARKAVINVDDFDPLDLPADKSLFAKTKKKKVKAA